MNRMKTLFTLLTATLLLVACARKSPYTKAIEERYSLKVEEVKKIQFYTSDDIILLKTQAQSGRETNKGELVVSSSTTDDRLIIKKGTPGVMVNSNGDKVQVSFETDAKTLTFESKSKNSSFYLLADSLANGKPIAKYGDETYIISQGSGVVYLQFKMKKLKKYKSRDTFVKGRKID